LPKRRFAICLDGQNEVVNSVCLLRRLCRKTSRLSAKRSGGETCVILPRFHTRLELQDYSKSYNRLVAYFYAISPSYNVPGK